MRFAERVQYISQSATTRMNETVQQRLREGKKVYNFTVGEPHFTTPEPIIQSAVEAMQSGKVKYAPVKGIPELRDKLARVKTQQYGVSLTRDNILITCGGKHALQQTLFSLVDTGDDVLIPAPAWVSFQYMVRLAEGNPIFVQTRYQNGFFPTSQELEQHRSKKTRVLILNSPNNPTGQTIREEMLRELIQWCIDHHIYLLYDETYEHLTFSGYRHWHPFHILKEWHPLILTAGSFSKTYCMTGWRVGWLIADREIVDCVARIQSHSTTSTSTISQWAACTALDLSSQTFALMKQTYEENAKYAGQFLHQFSGLHLIPPEGAFFVWFDIRSWLNALELSDEEFALRLLQEAGVGLVAGSAFGRSGFFRLSVAVDKAVLKEGLEAFETFYKKHVLPFLHTTF